MEINRKEHKIIFTGRVTAQQGDIQIYADKLIADYSENAREIISIVAMGSAKVVDKDRVALCGEIFMDNRNRTITMKDNPKLWEGDDLLEGEEIIYFIEEDRFKIKKASASIRSERVEK
jgi:lipopolysaccharide export system protein LptA